MIKVIHLLIASSITIIIIYTLLIFSVDLKNEHLTTRLTLQKYFNMTDNETDDDKYNFLNLNIAKWEQYLHIYDYIFNNYKINSILEIGVNRGGSLRLWKKLAQRVIGVDINTNPLARDLESIIIHGDQGDNVFLQELMKLDKFDLIIDDGSHYPKHQINTFNKLFPLLNRCGWFVVEDIQTSLSTPDDVNTNAITYFSTIVKQINYNVNLYEKLIYVQYAVFIQKRCDNQIKSRYGLIY